VSSIRVAQNPDGGWRVERDGIVIATEAEGMEETRRRISIAVGQW
jgi:hypothetical protein